MKVSKLNFTSENSIILCTHIKIKAYLLKGYIQDEIESSSYLLPIICCVGYVLDNFYQTLRDKSGLNLSW